MRRRRNLPLRVEALEGRALLHGHAIHALTFQDRLAAIRADYAAYGSVLPEDSHHAFAAGVNLPVLHAFQVQSLTFVAFQEAGANGFPGTPANNPNMLPGGTTSVPGGNSGGKGVRSS